MERNGWILVVTGLFLMMISSFGFGMVWQMYRDAKGI